QSWGFFLYLYPSRRRHTRWRRDWSSDVCSSDLSRATGGEFHHVEHVEALPRLMLRDTRRLIDPTAGLEDAPARIGIPGPMLAGLAEQDLPPVARWAPTRAKPGAELRLYVDAGERHDPLLATWQYELGRAAALPV